MAKREGYVCDGCGLVGGIYHMYTREKELPNEWFIVQTGLWKHDWDRLHFCSKACLGKFADGKVREPVQEKPSVLFKKLLKAMVGA